MRKKSLLGCLLLSFVVALAGCKSMKDDIDDLKKPTPTGVVILAHQLVAQNGSPVQIPFRVNPSNYVPTKEHLSLDVIESEITRASYGNSIPEYTLTDVQPAKNAQGEVIDGQWVATVEVKEGAYYSEAAIALILDYTDAQGNPVQMTSTSVALMSSKVKLTPEMVALRGFPACTYLDANTGLTIYTPVSLIAMPISEGSSTLFDLETVAVESVELTGDKAEQFALISDPSGLKWSVGANNAGLEFEEGEQFVPVTLSVGLRDQVGGELVTVTKTINFYKPEYTAPKVEYKLSEWPADNIQKIELGDALAQIGVTSDLFKKLRPDDYAPTILASLYRVLDAIGESSASSRYRAGLNMLNPRENTQDEWPYITSPETNYLQQRFYAKPETGDYMLSLFLQYTSPEMTVNADIQPTVKATIKIPVSVLP